MRLDFPHTHLAPTLVHGRAEVLLQGLPDNSIDAIVTDPPYEIDLGRMAGRSWDSSGIAFDVPLWGEVIRVLKPGGHLIAFGSPRTYHRLAVAVEDSGFEIRDSILAWVKAFAMVPKQSLAADLQALGHPGLAVRHAGVETQLKPGYEPIVVARKPLEGKTVAENLVLWGTGGLGIDATRVATDEDLARTPGRPKVGDVFNLQRSAYDRNTSHEKGRWPSNNLLIHRPDCVDGEPCVLDCAVAEMNRQKKDASRYFPTFYFNGRAPASERPSNGDVKHLSVKPLSVMEWLVALVAQPGQVVLDLFAGSGATVEAAMKLGVRSVAFEAEADYIPLIQQRIDREQHRQLADVHTHSFGVAGA